MSSTSISRTRLDARACRQIRHLRASSMRTMSEAGRADDAAAVPRAKRAQRQEPGTDAQRDASTPVFFALAVLLHLGVLIAARAAMDRYPLDAGPPATRVLVSLRATQVPLQVALTVPVKTSMTAPAAIPVKVPAQTDMPPLLAKDATATDAAINGSNAAVGEASKAASDPHAGARPAPREGLSPPTAAAAADESDALLTPPDANLVREADLSSFHPAETLTRRPELLAGAPDAVALDDTPLGSLLAPRGHLLLRLSIDRHGKVIAVHRLGSTMPAALADRIALTLFQAVYRPGEIAGEAVDSETLFFFNLQPDEELAPGMPASTVAHDAPATGR